MRRTFIFLLLASLFVAGCASAPASKETARTASAQVYSFGFETGDPGDWHPKGPVKIEVSDKFAHSGKYSLGASGRGETWHAPEMNVMSLMSAPGVYDVSCWIYIPKEGPEASVKMTVEIEGGGSKNWVQISKPVAVIPGQWAQLIGAFDRQPGLEKANLYIELLDPTVAFFLDDIEIAMAKE